MPRAIAARAPLSRDVVLTAAVALADERGLEGVSMRHLADALGVVPMALYKHVANQDDLHRRIAALALTEAADAAIAVAAA